MPYKIALAGNPNCGKTTLFNLITGSNQFVGNWPGVTVEKKEGKLKKQNDVIIIDLPGIYSLSPYTLEEVVTRNYLVDERPDLILNIIDGTNLERNLYLTTQLSEIGIPIVVAINMMDVVAKNGDKINIQQLSKAIGCDVVEISALKATGIEEVIETSIKTIKNSNNFVAKHNFSGSVEHSIAHIEEAVLNNLPENQQRWYAIKLFERDGKIIEKLSLTKDTIFHIENDIKNCEEELDDDSESIITNERYNYIDSIIKKCYTKKNKGNFSASDKIDRIVTNRWLALPIFTLVMFVVYFISVTTVGTWVTDFTNDTLFGEIIAPGLTNILESIDTSPWLLSLLVDGIVGGVGAVLGFVPQMLVLFLFLAFLESCGYMARIAFIMDRIFKNFGLSGKSFIPMLIGTGCSVPGIMASRTIENDRDRKMTIITTSFIPCGAKLPIIALIAGALFNGAWWVAPTAYFIGIFAVLISGIILKKTKLFSGDAAPFVMELPAYHMPTIKNLLRSMWERGWSFIKKAGTVILLSTILIWFASTFGWTDGNFGFSEMEDSILAKIGSLIAPLFIPLGFGDWKSAVATITGLIAKENVVGTFGVLFGFAEVSENGSEVWGTLASSFTTISAFSFLVFNLLCAPCFAAIGAIRREMNNYKWLLFAITYQTILAYISSFSIYQIGTFISQGTFSVLTLISFLIVAFVLLLLIKPKKSNKIQSNEPIKNY